MIFVAIRIDVREDRREEFRSGIARYVDDVRGEPGNIDFTCFEDLGTPNRFAVLASYVDADAGSAHVASDHAKWFFGWLPTVVTETPRIVYQELPGEGWSEMAEARPS